MNAIEDNEWSRAFRALGEKLPTPRAILSVSAHWFVGGTYLTGNERPKTIHDFGGFPQELYDMRYPAPGSPELAERVVALLDEGQATVTDEWGLDHGTWSVLHHLRPAADVPVVQLSIDWNVPPAEHLAIGRALAPLRDEGVLVMGSGNIVHNLRHAFAHMDDPVTPRWAEEFDAGVERAVVEGDAEWLTGAVESEVGRMSHPTLDHYLPLLYAVGAAEGGDAPTFPITGFALNSLSMRAVMWG
jgi:4,5-DOPA dioxygenase extradiol